MTQRRCRFCYSTHRVRTYFYGGYRPDEKYAKPECPLCSECWRVVELLRMDHLIQFRGDIFRDTTNSRFATLKAAVKRFRFGNANASREQMEKK